MSQAGQLKAMNSKIKEPNMHVSLWKRDRNPHVDQPTLWCVSLDGVWVASTLSLHRFLIVNICLDMKESRNNLSTAKDKSC